MMVKSQVYAVVLLIFSISTVVSYSNFRNALTQEQRNEVFGTNSAESLPFVDEIHIDLVKVIPDIKPFRKRPADTLIYNTTINDEQITLILHPSQEFITPGCLEHNYHKNKTKSLYPCFKEDKHCYYTGRSHHKDSLVAASVCGGLRGLITYGNRSLVVFPLEKSHDQELPRRVKLGVYRFKGNKQRCSTQDLGGQILYPTLPPEIRRRRDSRKRYIETSVVIDPTVMKSHGHNIDQFLATALNIASRLYSNGSTGQNIELVITNVHKIVSYEFLQIEHTKDAAKLLQELCDWKARQNDPTLNKDATIFLTKTQIEYKETIETVGLANTRGMCQKNRSCALIQDTGITMGYTIAHEVGHLLSMKHDGLDGDTSCGSSIMNRYGASGRAASRWSPCSKHALAEFLSSNDSDCLLNKPEGYTYSAQKRNLPLPGVLYTLDDQCKFVSGPHALHCSIETHLQELRNYKVNNSCEQLLCKSEQLGMCNLLTFPALDGTDINNTRTWCQNGEPVAITDADNTRPKDGQWSEWTAEWSNCTRTCGGGVKKRRRACNNPKPQYGGATCPGSDVKSVLCNLQNCMRTDLWKEAQCSELDKNHYPEYGNASFTFTPYRKSIGDKSCEVQCQAVLSPNRNIIFINRTSNYYPDGTICRPADAEITPFNRCIDGKCRKFGCDGHLDSGLNFDVCGKCNGTGRDCNAVRGSFSADGPEKEYETVLRLPKKSAGIVVKENNLNCFLRAVFAGKRKVTLAGYDAMTGFISDGVHYFDSPERIEIYGPIPREVEIQVYRMTVDDRPEIEYVYHEITSTAPKSYIWSIMELPCTKTCGSGLHIPVVRCWGLTGPVEDHNCDIYEKPDETPRPCNTHNCPPRWIFGAWTDCSVTCENGTRTRSVQCVQENENGNFAVSESLCTAGIRPERIHTCNMGECPSVWNSGNWSECSKTCGEGRMYRQVQCYDLRNTSVRVADSHCLEDQRPAAQTKCILGPCRTDLVGENCTDKTDCKQYGDDICVDIYEKWATENCMKYCGICDAREDNPGCQWYFSNYNGYEFCKEYTDWSRRNCFNMCKPYFEACQDVNPNCSQYYKKHCKDPMYAVYMKANCFAYCGYCDVP